MSQRTQFRAFLKTCQDLPPPRDLTPVYDKLRGDEIARYHEAEALTSGAILEAVLQKGSGDAKPQEGDLVYFHFTLRRVESEENVVFSTRLEDGSTDATPLSAILQKAPRLPRAWELALLEMQKGERRVLKVRPEFGFHHKDCEFHLPKEYREAEGEELLIDLQLLHWYGAEDVMSVMGASSDAVLKRVLHEGEGYENPRPPYRVQAMVTLRQLASDGVQLKGNPLFSSETPLELTMGDESIPAEIQACLSSMVKKEKAICIFSIAEGPPRQSSVFPPFPEGLLQLEAEIEILNVIQVRDIYGDGKIMKYRVKDGEGAFPSDCPLQDCRVTIHYKARPINPSSPSDWCYDSRDVASGDPISIDLGCGELPMGLEACIHLMLPKEVSRVECLAECAYNNANTRCPAPSGISPDQDCEFEVELLHFQKGMQWAGITPAETLQEAQRMKTQANALYKEGATQLAAKKYQKVVQQLSAMRDFETDEQVEEADTLTLTCYSNLASCAIQDEEYPTAIDWCNKALKMNDENAKVLLRRAKAYSLHGDFEEAEQDLQQVEKLDPSLKSEVEAALLKNRQRRKAAVMKQKQQFRNFFDRSKDVTSDL